MAADYVTLGQCIDALEVRRQVVNEALQDFTRPVAACDVDYNTLLAERGALNLALSHLLPLCRGEMKIPHPREDLVAH
ncbi:MAG: hypothetical protein ABI905_08490 [Betaproteobacteria bacterium]